MIRLHFHSATLLAGTVMFGSSVFQALAADIETDKPLPVAQRSSEATYPYVDGELDLEFGNDWFFRADEPDNKLNDLFIEAALGFAIHFNPYLTVNLGLTFEPVIDPQPATNRYFGDLGLYADTLNLEATIGGLAVTAGKFSPGFGKAWDTTPGIYSTDLVEDYELSEMLGLGITYSFEQTLLGNVTLGANLFTADTSLLSDSLFTRRGRLTLGDGGIANTGRLDNFSFTVDGEDIASLPGFSWHLGYRHQEPGIDGGQSENGFVAGVAQAFELENDVELLLNGEFAYLSNVFASAGDALYATAGVGVTRGPWHGEFAGTMRRMKFSDGGAQNDYLLQVSGGHKWDNGFDFSLGYAFMRDEGQGAHLMGLRLTKTFEFSSR